MSKVFHCFIEGTDKSGRFPGLNEIIGASRSKYGQVLAAKQKRDCDQRVWLIAKAHANKIKWRAPDEPVKITFIWHEPNKRRDQDNITESEKFILDGLVKAKILKNDNQKYIPQATQHYIVIDKKRTGVELFIEKLGEQNGKD